MEKQMKIMALLVLLPLFTTIHAEVNTRIPSFLRELVYVSYQARTQVGEMEAYLSVCVLETNRGEDSALYITNRFEREYTDNIDRILKNAHSPKIELDEDEISIFYTSGVNTSCVTIYTIKDGIAQYKLTDTIAWNEGGEKKFSDSYKNLTNPKKDEA